MRDPFGLTLFEKAGRGLAPTPTGLLLAEQSEDALSSLAQVGIAPRVAARCQDHHTSFALVAAGVGITLVPQLTTGALPQGAVAIPLASPAIERGIAVLVRDGVAGHPVTRRELELLHGIAQRALAQPGADAAAARA